MVVQVGNQQRSAPTSIEAMQDIADGIIGNVYFGKAWYANTPRVDRPWQAGSCTRMAGLGSLAGPRLVMNTRITWYITTGTGSGIGDR